MKLNDVKKSNLENDIDKIKSNKVTEEELDAMMAEYDEALSELDAKKKAAPKKTASSTKKSTTAKKAPAKKTETKKESSAKKAPAKKAAPVKKEPAKKPAPKGRSYNGKYEVYPSGDGYQYRLKASNGEILVVSETYVSRESVLKAIDAVQRNLETGEIRIIEDKHGMFKFQLKSKNHRVLALGSNYSTEKSATRASESFKNFAVKADIVDVDAPAEDDASIGVLFELPSDIEEKTGGKFVIEKFNGEFSWDLKASNGQILCQAEGYTSKAGVQSSIESFKKNVETGSFKIIKDKNENYHYKLYTASGRVAAVGETYNSKQLAESAVVSVVSYYKNSELTEKQDEE